MNLIHKYSNLCSNIQQTHAVRSVRSVWPGLLTDRIPGAGVLRLINGLESALRWCVGRISCWRQRRTAIRKLQALNDHYLKDIGLHRSEIVWSVEETIRLDTHWS